jgi:hypothetical protein
MSTHSCPGCGGFLMAPDPDGVTVCPRCGTRCPPDTPQPPDDSTALTATAAAEQRR